MVNTVKKKSFKETCRKFIVSLKRRPHNIALVFLLITYVVYSFNLSKISHTTAVVYLDGMGLCSFVVMLFSILAMVSYLNAFPVRQKPKIPMVIIFYFLEVLLLLADILYYLDIVNGLAASPELIADGKNDFVLPTQNIIMVHMIMVGVSILLVALIPVIGKLLNKINTSIKVEDSANVTKIDIDNE